MKRSSVAVLFGLILIFIINQVLERLFQIRVHFFYSYLDDILSVPITLGTYELIMHIIHPKRIKSPSGLFILICIIAFSFHFEFLMPKISNKYTADWMDVIMYCLGGIFYFIIFIDRSKVRKKLSYENI